MPTYLPFFPSYAPSATSEQNPYITLQQRAQQTAPVSQPRQEARSQYDTALQNAGFMRPFSGFSGGMAPMYGGFQYSYPQFNVPQQGEDGGSPGMPEPNPPSEISFPNVPAGPGGYFGIMDFIRSLRGQGTAQTEMLGGFGSGGPASGQVPGAAQPPALEQPATGPSPPTEGGSGSITAEERQLFQRAARGPLSPAEHERRRAVLRRLNPERQAPSPLVATRSTYSPNINPRRAY